MTSVYSLNDGIEDEENPSVLFFGRNKCSGTERTLNHLSRCGFRVTCVLSKGRGEPLPENLGWWRGEYILCFRSLFILPKYLIEKASVAAINFHPAPPEYPGSGCINFALYDGCESYGVTAHLMNEKIDNGKILECRRFPVCKNDNLSTVGARTYSELTGLCLDFITQISSRGDGFIRKRLLESKNISWRGEARRISELEKLQEISPTAN